MKLTLLRLWQEEAGAVIGAELAVMLTLLVIGVIGAWSGLRDAIAEELTEVALAIDALDQSYHVTIPIGYRTHDGQLSGGAAGWVFKDDGPPAQACRTNAVCAGQPPA